VVQGSGEDGTSEVQGIGDDEIGEDRTDARIKKIVRAMKRVEPQPEGADVYRLGDKHRFFKKVDELVDPWKRLYQIAADRAGLDLKDLVREVFRLENMWFKHLDGRDG
jgi:RNA polymerase I-specific transcription initiation factor RRN7